MKPDKHFWRESVQKWENIIARLEGGRDPRDETYGLALTPCGFCRAFHNCGLCPLGDEPCGEDQSIYLMACTSMEHGQRDDALKYSRALLAAIMRHEDKFEEAEK